jgi:benzoate-CoA ligase
VLFRSLNKEFSATKELEMTLKAFVKTVLAHYKFPRWIEFVEDLPKTATGKIKRFILADNNMFSEAKVA